MMVNGRPFLRSEDHGLRSLSDLEAFSYEIVVKNKFMLIALVWLMSVGMDTCYPINPSLPARYRNYFTSPPLSGSLLRHRKYPLGRMLNTPPIQYPRRVR